MVAATPRQQVSTECCMETICSHVDRVRVTACLLSRTQRAAGKPGSTVMTDEILQAVR